MSFVTISVAVLRRPGLEPLLSGCLEALADQSRTPDEILIVDQVGAAADSDVGAAWTRRFPGAPARVLSGPASARRNPGRNQAFEEARSEWVAVLDGDTRPAVDWLERLEEALKKDSGASALAGRLQESQRDSLAGAWRSLHLPEHWGDVELEFPPFLHASGALYHRRTALESAAPAADLDPEDTDEGLCGRLYLRGRRLRYVPAAGLFRHRSGDRPRAALEAAWERTRPNAEQGGFYRRASRYRGYVLFLRDRTLAHLKRDLESDGRGLPLTLNLLPYLLIRDVEHMAGLKTLSPEAAESVCRGLLSLRRAGWGQTGMKDSLGPELWTTLLEKAPVLLAGGLDQAGVMELVRALPGTDPALWFLFVKAWSLCLTSAPGAASPAP